MHFLELFHPFWVLALDHFNKPAINESSPAMKVNKSSFQVHTSALEKIPCSHYPDTGELKTNTWLIPLNDGLPEIFN